MFKDFAAQISRLGGVTIFLVVGARSEPSPPQGPNSCKGSAGPKQKEGGAATWASRVQKGRKLTFAFWANSSGPHHVPSSPVHPGARAGFVAHRSFQRTAPLTGSPWRRTPGGVSVFIAARHPTLPGEDRTSRIPRTPTRRIFGGGLFIS